MKQIFNIFIISLILTFTSAFSLKAQECRANYIHIQGAGTEVAFINKSFGEITEARWEFGDGTTSSELNPVHEFKKPGYYLLSMSVSSASGDVDELFKIIHVHSKEELLTASANGGAIASNNSEFAARSMDGLFECFDKFFEDATIIKTEREVPSF